MEWIDVKQELPPDIEMVLVYAKNGRNGHDPVYDIGISFYSREFGDWHSFFDCGSAIVSHWMPLPTPPTK